MKFLALALVAFVALSTQSVVAQTTCDVQCTGGLSTCHCGPGHAGRMRLAVQQVCQRLQGQERQPALRVQGPSVRTRTRPIPQESSVLQLPQHGQVELLTRSSPVYLSTSFFSAVPFVSHVRCHSRYCRCIDSMNRVHVCVGGDWSESCRADRRGARAAVETQSSRAVWSMVKHRTFRSVLRA